MNRISRGALKRTAGLGTMLLLMLALASPVYAGSATKDGYAEQGAQVQGQVQTEEKTAVAAVSSDDDDNGGSLPFTGLGLAVIAGTGAALLGAGFAMRHLARRPQSDEHTA